MAPRPSSESLIAGFLSQYSNPSTREVYSIAMRDLGDWAVTHGVANIADVQKPHLDLYGRHLEDEGLKPNSRASKQGVIKRFFAYLVDSGTIRQSPVPTGWVPRQEPRKALEVLAGEDMDAMFRAAREHKDFLDVGMFVALSGWDGLTVGHIMGIVAEDVRLDSDGTRCVPIRRKDGTIQNKPLSPQSSNHVATVLKGRPSGRLCYPTRPVEAARSAARRGLRSVAREAGIPGQMNSTRLWWSYRSRMLEAGTPIEVLLAAVGRDGSSGGAYSRKVALPRHGPESDGQASLEMAVHENNAAELLRQAEHLCNQSGITPIAPIVIAGAALEMVLRRMCEVNTVDVPSKQPGISAYADALKRRTLISKFAHQQMHAHAKLRNDAAHGVASDEVSVEHARVMIRSVGLFLAGSDDG